jgi:hypothetical protein
MKSDALLWKMPGRIHRTIVGLPVFGKMLAWLKISAGLKNYENLKIEIFDGFFARPVKTRPDS